MNTTQTLSFANAHFFIGVDTHLKSWKVTIRTGGIELKTFSMNPAPMDLLAYLHKHYPDGIYHIVYEAGFCGFWALRIFKEHDIDCIIVNPADVPTTNKEKVNKSDPIDSRKLAREHENKSLHGIYIPSHEPRRTADAHALAIPHHSISNTHQEQNQRIVVFSRYSNPSAVLSLVPVGLTLLFSHLKSLSMNTSAGNFTLHNLIAQLQEIREHNKNILKQLRTEAKKETIAPIITALDSVPGVAFISAMYLYCEIIDMKRFPDEDHLNAFVGLVPFDSNL